MMLIFKQVMNINLTFGCLFFSVNENVPVTTFPEIFSNLNGRCVMLPFHYALLKALRAALSRCSSHGCVRYNLPKKKNHYAPVATPFRFPSEPVSILWLN